MDLTLSLCGTAEGLLRRPEPEDIPENIVLKPKRRFNHLIGLCDEFKDIIKLKKFGIWLDSNREH
jgi:hypothetical protein